MSYHDDRAGEGDLTFLSPADRMALALRADECGMSPAEYVAALVDAHLTRRPQWNAGTYAELQAVSTAVRQLGSLVREMRPAVAVHVAVPDMVLALNRRLDAMTEDQARYWQAA